MARAARPSFSARAGSSSRRTIASASASGSSGGTSSASSAVRQDLGDTADRRGDDRTAERHRLQQGERETLGPRRHHEDLEARHDRPRVLAGAEEPDRRVGPPGELLELGPQAAVADHHASGIGDPSPDIAAARIRTSTPFAGRRWLTVPNARAGSAAVVARAPSDTTASTSMPFRMRTEAGRRRERPSVARRRRIAPPPRRRSSGRCGGR